MHRHVLLALATIGILATPAEAADLTARDLVALVKSGLSEDLIRAQIDVTGAQVVLSAADLIALAHAGASEALIRHAIRSRTAGPASVPRELAGDLAAAEIARQLRPALRPHPAVSPYWDRARRPSDEEPPIEPALADRIDVERASPESGPWDRPGIGYGYGYGLGYGFGVYSGAVFDDYTSPYGFSVGRGPVRFFNERRPFERALELGLGNVVPFPSSRPPRRYVLDRDPHPGR